jgi:hypothetical protein
MMKVYCYFNLHKKVFSLKNHKTKLVECHATTVRLDDCIFKVSQAGRQRVLKEKRKNVHAGVQGMLRGRDFSVSVKALEENFVELTYNPYKYDSFVIKATGEPIEYAEMVILNNKRIFAKGLQVQYMRIFA